MELDGARWLPKYFRKSFDELKNLTNSGPAIFFACGHQLTQIESNTLKNILFGRILSLSIDSELYWYYAQIIFPAKEVSKRMLRWLEGAG